MYILNLKTAEIIDHFREDFYSKVYPYLILSTACELKLLKDILDIDEITFNDCLEFDENIKLDLFDNYDFLSLNTCELSGNEAKIEEVNMYLSDNFILVICEKDNFLYDYVKSMILNNSKIQKHYNPSNLFKISYLIIKNIIIHEFENLEKVEDMKLYNFALSTRELADKLLDIYSSKVAEQTNDIITKLTLLTAISAPLTIITGIYGMNFKFMPELNLYYGYPLTIGIMFIIVLCGIILFKIKKLL